MNAPLHSREWFIEQIQMAKDDIATWPKWMRDACVIASAHFPRVPEIAAPPSPQQEPPEGCTPADAAVLRQANHALADESHALQEALADLYSQVKTFCAEQGEADFYTGRALAILCKVRPLEYVWPFADKTPDDVLAATPQQEPPSPAAAPNWRAILKRAREGIAAGSCSISDIDHQNAIALPLLDHLAEQFENAEAQAAPAPEQADDEFAKFQAWSKPHLWSGDKAANDLAWLVWQAARSQASPPVEPQPVAWRYRYHPGGSWKLADGPAIGEINDDVLLGMHPNFEEQPLYSAPPPQSKEVAQGDALDAKDAHRYRWLRDIGDKTWPPMAQRPGCSAALIDAAIAMEPETVFATSKEMVGIARAALAKIDAAIVPPSQSEQAPTVQPAHTDHPLRHWDRTCPACIAEAQSPAPAPRGTIGFDGPFDEQESPAPAPPEAMGVVHAGRQLSAEDAEAVYSGRVSLAKAMMDLTQAAPAPEQEPMSLAVALDFADNPRPYHTLQAPADTNGELYRALKTIAAEYRKAAQPSPPVEPVARIKGAWIDGGYVIVTPAGGVDAKDVKAFILAAFAAPPPQTADAQPTNKQDAAAGNANAIRHVAYAEGYADGKAFQQTANAQAGAPTQDAKDAERLDAMAANPRWHLDCEVLKFGNPGKWRVWKLLGNQTHSTSIKTLGEGDTPRAAIDSAIAAKGQT